MKFFNNIKTTRKGTENTDGVFVGGQQPQQTMGEGRRRAAYDGLRRRSMSGFSTDDEAEAAISTDGMSAILHATTAVDSDDGSSGSSVGDGSGSSGSSAGFNSQPSSLLSSTDSKTHTTEGTGATDKAGSIANAISKTETRRVVTVRIVVVTMLVLVAAGVSVGVYFIMKQSNENEFALQFEGAADKVVEHFEEIMVEISSVSALAIAASAHSVDHDAEWPYVSLSNFAERAGNARWSSGALQVSINPIVYSSQLDEWEEWVQLPENNYWM